MKRLLIGLMLLVGSCKAYQPPITSTDGDAVFVAFEVVSGGKGDSAFNWFDCPGHSYVRGDKYPDTEKYEKRQ